VTAHEPALAARSFDYDDDVEDKTIPAAELPDEIKKLRAQFVAARKQSVPTQASGAEASPREKVLTDKVLPTRETTAPRSDAVPAATRTASGDTLSITNKGNPMAWEDDDEGVKTAIARPNELPGLIAARAAAVARRPAPSPLAFDGLEVEQPPSGTNFQPTEDRAQPMDSMAEQEAEQPRRTGLILALVVLAALAVLGMLVLLDVVPLPKLGGRKAGAGQVLVSERAG